MNKRVIASTISNIYTLLCTVLVVIGIASLVAVAIGIRPFVMISESMHPEVPKNSLVLLSTHTSLSDIDVGDNVGYVLGKVEAMHKTIHRSSDDLGNVDEIVVKSLADDGESMVTASTYVGKEVLSIPAVGGWIRKALDYKWAIVAVAAVLIIIGCIPRKNNQKEEDLKAAAGA